MKKYLLYFLVFFVAVSVLSCSKAEIRQAKVLTQAEIDKHNNSIPDEPAPEDPTTPPTDEPVEPSDPGAILPSDPNNKDRITDGSAYFVRQQALGLKDGSSWNNALDVAGLRRLISQRRDSENAQNNELAYAQADSLDGVKIYLTAGSYLMADSDWKYLKMEWTGYSKQVSVSFYGGYDERSSGIDLTQRNVSTYSTIMTGDANFNNRPDASDYQIFVFGNQTDVLFDGIYFCNAYTPANGGAILAAAGGGNCTVTLNNCVFRNNQADPNQTSGAAIFIAKAHVKAKNCTFSNNSARNGAAVYTANNSQFTAEDCSFTYNTASNCGGVGNISGGTHSFKNCTFSNNTSRGYAGGALHINGEASVTCDNATFTANEAQNRGGAISIEQGTLTINSSKIFGNRVTPTDNLGNLGGIIAMLKANGIVHINNTDFYNNTSAGTSAAVFLNQGRLYMNNVKAYNNTSDNRGIFSIRSGLCYMNNVSITGNTVTGDWGTALAFTASTFCANNLTIAGNKGSSNNDSVLNGTANSLFVNSTVANESKLGVLRIEANRKSYWLNSILLNTTSGGTSVLFSGDASVTSLGSCIVGALSGTGDGKVYTSGAGDAFNANFATLNATWDATSYVYKWSGNYSGHTRMNPSDFEAKIKATFSDLTVMGKVDDTEVFSVSNIGNDFYNWVISKSSTAFTTDVLGTSRGSSAVAGSFQAK